MAAKSDGSVIFTIELAAKEAEKEIAKLKSKIISMEESLNEQGYKKTALEEQLAAAGVRADEAKAKLAELLAERDRLKSLTPTDGAEYLTAGQKITALNQQIKEQEAIVKDLDKEYNSVANSLDLVNQKMQETTVATAAAKDAMGELQQIASETSSETDETAGHVNEVADEAERSADGMKRTGKETKRSADEAKGLKGVLGDVNNRMAKFSNRIIGMAKRVFVFTLISKALRSLRDYLWDTIKANDEAVAAIARLKGAMLTLAQPIVNYIIPAFTRLVDLLSRVAAYAASIVSRFFGTTATKSAAQAKKASENIEDEADAIEGVKEEAKEAEKQLAGFDELNILTSDKSEDQTNKLDDLADTLDTSDTIAPDFSGIIDRELSKIDALIGAALIAVGAILTFTGANIPLGLALMIAGFLLEYEVIKENWGTIVEALQGPIGILTAIISGAFLVIGAILAFSGANVGLGISMMILGAIGLASVMSVNWATIVTAMQGPIGVLTAILGASFLVIGAVFAFSGVNVGLGVAMMIAGAIGMATAAAANWDTIVTALQGPIGTITALLSAALLVLGGILTLSGAAAPLGIGLMILGAAGLATDAVVNWNTITNALQGEVGKITGIISSVFLVLGAVLTFTGAAVPLGLGLLIAGATGLAVSMQANWGTITELLSGEFGVITAAASTALLALGVILCLSGVGVPLGIALIAAGAAGLVTVTAVNWGDAILSGIKSGWGKIKGWFTGAAEPDSGDMGESIGEGLAKGVDSSQKTVRESMEQMADEAINETMETLDIHSPSGVFMGIGQNITKGLNVGISDKTREVLSTMSGMWDNIKTQTDEKWEKIKVSIDDVWGKINDGTGGALDKIKDRITRKWDDIRNWFDTSVAPKLTVQYWEDKLKSIGDGFKNAIVSGLNAGIDVVERGLNWVISALNKISFTVPEWVPEVGGKKFGFDIKDISIPRLAQGAVIPPNREFMAVLGDQRSGVNVETPLSTMVEAFKQAMAEGGGMGGGTIVLKVDLDGREIARSTYANFRQMARAGTSGTMIF